MTRSSRIAATSVALAMGVSALTAPASHAATVSAPNADGVCKVTYTDAEKKAAERLDDQSLPVMGSFIIDVAESAYPGSLRIAEQFKKESAVQDYANAFTKGGNPSAEQEAKYKNVIAEYTQQLVEKVGLSVNTARSLLLVATSAVTAPTSKVSDLLPSAVVYDPEGLAELEELASISFDDFVQDFPTFYSGPSAEAQKWRNAEIAMLTSDKYEGVFRDVFAAEQAQYRAEFQCAKGKAGDVAFPTKYQTVKGSSANGSSQNGELSPGAIAGIVIGVIALVAAGVGALAFVAPQFGVELPFALPQLPF